MGITVDYLLTYQNPVVQAGFEMAVMASDRIIVTKGLISQQDKG